SLRALRGDRAAVGLDDLLRAGQADARADGAPGDVPAAVEALKDVRQVAGGDADPAIRHAQHRNAPVADGLAAHHERDRAAGGAVLDGVYEQVHDHALQAALVTREAERRPLRHH